MKNMLSKMIAPIACCLCSLLLLCGCQPTPEEDPVVNSGSEDIRTLVLRRPSEEKAYDVPDRWDETFEVRERTVRIEAAVEASAGPFAVQMVERSSFDATAVVKAAKGFFGAGLQLRANDHSREEVLIDIANTAKGFFEDFDENGDPIWLPYNGQDEQIAELQGFLAEAPAEDSFIDMTAENLGQRVDFAMKDPSGRLYYGHLSGDATYLNLRRERLMCMQEEFLLLDEGGYPGEDPHPLMNIKISEEDAVAAGQELLRKIGAPEDMELASVFRARSIENYTYHCWGEGYLLYFTSAAGGTRAYNYERYTESSSFYFPSDGDEYGVRWQQERICMFVTEEGVLDLTWAAPKRVLSTVNDSVELLPFSELQEKARSLIGYGILGSRADTSHEGDILVTRIVLGTALVRIPDNGTEAYLIPVWMLEVFTEQEQLQGQMPSILMINALTGAYVSRWGW